MCISNLPKKQKTTTKTTMNPTNSHRFTFAFSSYIPFCTHTFCVHFCSNTSVQMYNNLPIHQTQVVAQPTSSAGPVINQLALQQYLAQQQQQQPSAQAVS